MVVTSRVLDHDRDSTLTPNRRSRSYDFIGEVLQGQEDWRGEERWNEEKMVIISGESEYKIIFDLCYSGSIWCVGDLSGRTAQATQEF